MITPDQVGEYLTHLAESDEDAAELKIDVERQQYILKRVEAAHFIAADGNVKERECKAKTSVPYIEQEKKYFDAYLKSEKLNNQRKTWALQIEVYRTQSANRRMGS